jgi:pimeloyl-ACP methyl ester carboxylesterase
MATRTPPKVSSADLSTFQSYRYLATTAAADNVSEVIIRDSGHWLMEEQPEAIITAIRSLLAETDNGP